MPQRYLRLPQIEGVDWDAIIARLAPAGVLGGTAARDDDASPPDPNRYLSFEDYFAPNRAGGYTSAESDPPNTSDPASYTGPVFGAGQQTFGEGLKAFGSGLRSGVTGQALKAFDMPALAKPAVKLAAQMAMKAAGIPSVTLTAADTLFGGLMGLAQGALKSEGYQVAPIRFGGPAVVPIPGVPNVRADEFPVPDANPVGAAPTGISGLAAPTFGLDIGLAPTAPTFGDLGSNPFGLGPPGIPSAEVEAGLLGSQPTFADVFGTGLADPGPVPSAYADMPTFADVFGDPAFGGIDPSEGFGGIGDGGDGGDDGGGVGDGSGVGAYYHGGPVQGPPGRDQVPGQLTAGEFVVDADSARRFGPLLEYLNSLEPRDRL